MQMVDFFSYSEVPFINFIMLFLESIGMGFAINESCYKGTTLQRNHRKITIKMVIFL